MKTPKTILQLLIVVIFPAYLHAQQPDKVTKQAIRQQDSLFWSGYNHCDFALLNPLIADDIEFYHDKGGITSGKKAMLESLKSLCGPDFHLRRAAVDSTVKIHLLKAKDTVYGAVITGTHQFYLSPAGKPERLDGRAEFANLWLRKAGSWKMARVFSYDHGPAVYSNKRKQVKVSGAILQSYAGKYKGKQTGSMTVTALNDHLLLQIGDKPYLLYPESTQVFFTTDRDLTFSFEHAGGRVKGLVIREFGEVAEEAAIQ